jgi:hypothetical protein
MFINCCQEGFGPKAKFSTKSDVWSFGTLLPLCFD